MLANLSERDRRTLQWGAYAAGGILFLMVAGFPAMDKWDSLNGQIDRARGDLDRIKSDLSDAAQSQMMIQKLREEATIHPERSSLNQQTYRMLQEVQKLPAYKQISVARLEGLPLREEDRIFRSAISLQFTGKLADLHEFLKQMESAKPGLKTERLSLIQDPKDAAKIDGQMVIAGYALVLKKAKAGSPSVGAEKKG